AVRAGPRTVVLALALRRESLARLREDPRAAITFFGPDLACTAHGRAAIVGELTDGVVAVRLDVERVQDHGQPTFAVEDGVRWRWTDPEAERRDAEVHRALRALADSLPPP
ncbi:MAG TPA: hypothetical protein VGJ32_06990, partial [Solirubrobacteraceae bacterium]